MLFAVATLCYNYSITVQLGQPDHTKMVDDGMADERGKRL